MFHSPVMHDRKDKKFKGCLLHFSLSLFYSLDFRYAIRCILLKFYKRLMFLCKSLVLTISRSYRYGK